MQRKLIKLSRRGVCPNNGAATFTNHVPMPQTVEQLLINVQSRLIGRIILSQRRQADKTVRLGSVRHDRACLVSWSVVMQDVATGTAWLMVRPTKTSLISTDWTGETRHSFYSSTGTAAKTITSGSNHDWQNLSIQILSQIFVLCCRI